METDQLDSSSQICIVVGKAHTASPLPDRPFSGYQWEVLSGKLLRAGINPQHVKTLDLSCGAYPTEKVIIGMGEDVLTRLTNKKGIFKWHLSPLEIESSLFIPTFDFTQIQKQYELGLYLEMALHRATEYLTSPYVRHVEHFQINPSLEQVLAVLKDLEGKEEIAIDVETGYGQINTVGFAWSESDAIAINTLPDRCGSAAYFELWNAIARVLEGGSRKIFQNFMYDTSYFSAYGIRVGGELFDTMHAMKVLWPELDSNLGNVGRIYTRRPYWKDDGKVESEEGKKKDWGNVRDWVRHYLYNCRDTSGTWEAAQKQKSDLRKRGLYDFYSSYICRLMDPVREMCANGMPLDLPRREALKGDIEGRIESLTREFQRQAGEVNPKSSRQVQKWIKGKGIKLPRKYDKASGAYRETADANAIKKIRLKNDLPGLKALQEIKVLDKALSSYINFDVRSDGCASYSLNITGTETLRWSGGKDGWDRGFNIQTIPREGGEVSIKSMFLAPPGYSFIEVDLRQAESRFVAYDSADHDLINMLETGQDIHSHVGTAILRQMGRDPNSISKEEFKATWRQLGKKAGHGLNYGMKAKVFVETVFNELDMVISLSDAESIREAYYNLFPGIPRWHKWIKKELYEKRKLTTPFGWERYFYGRPGDDMFKEGAAFRPQSTIPYLTNCLMLYLHDLRKEKGLHFKFIDQVHDSLLLLSPEDEVSLVAKVCLDTKAGHPIIDLPGGRMFIPREVKVGARMNAMEEFGE